MAEEIIGNLVKGANIPGAQLHHRYRAWNENMRGKRSRGAGDINVAYRQAWAATAGGRR